MPSEEDLRQGLHLPHVQARRGLLFMLCIVLSGQMHHAWAISTRSADIFGNLHELLHHNQASLLLSPPHMTMHH